MHKLLLVLLMCFFHPAYAQHDNRITIGTVENIYSNVLHEDRQVWVHMPDTSGSFYGTARYPVVYLLDGDAHFPAVAGIMQFLSQTNSIIPKMILVGIPNTDRMRDLTPSHDRTVPKDSNMMRTTGGGENFIAFIEKELMPYINAHYPAAPYSVLIGHSLGGLLVVHTLLNHSNLFNAYIALDPSLFWDNQKTLREGMDAFSRSDYKNRSLFMASSEGLPAGTDTAAIEQDTAMATIVIRPVLKFDRAVKASSANGLSYRWQCYPQESHATLPLPATYDGLRFTFAFAQLPPVKRDTVTTDFYKHHYQAVSRKMGYTFLPPEDLVNGMGYYFLQRNMYDRSHEFFQMNIDNYPASYNVYDSMSDLYAAEGNKKKAIELLQKELTLADKPYIRQKLAALQSGK